MRQGMKVITTSMVMLVSFMIFSVTVLATSFDFDSLFEEHERVEVGGYAFDMYIEAASMDDVESYSLNMHIFTAITEYGNEPLVMEIFLEADMVINCFDSGDVYLRMDMVSDDLEITIYYRDGMMYLDMPSLISIRTPSSLYEAMASMDGIPEIPRESVIAERIVYSDEGTEVTLLIDINYLTELVDEMREVAGEAYQLEFSNVLITVLIDEAGFSRLTTMSYSMQMINEYGEIDKIEFFIEIEITQFGDVEIYFPAYINDFWLLPNFG